MKAEDVLIVGGGVIGLSVAYALAREGIRCRLVDRGPLGKEASWAGAGIISPGSVVPMALPMARLRTLSARLFPEWSEWLREETGIDNGYCRSGGLHVALTSGEEHNLRAAAGRWRVEGIAHEFLDQEEVRRVEPALGPAIRSGVLVPDRAQVRNPRHLRALASACLRRGVTLYPGRPVLGFEMEGGRVHAVQTPTGPLRAGMFVVAAGTWTGPLLETIGLRAPTPPVKGQIVLLNDPSVRLTRIIELGKNYLVPRGDGRILVGATEEEAGYDTRATGRGARELLDLAIRLCPGLADSWFEATWAGLRPGSRDTRPYIGPAPGFENLILAAGHNRAGLQLSPGTGSLVADLIVGRSPSIPLDDFRLDRGAVNDDADAFRS